MEAEPAHLPLCTIELIARGHGERCPGEACPYWEDGCILARIEAELDGRPEVAEVLLSVRQELEEMRRQTVDFASRPGGVP